MWQRQRGAWAVGSAFAILIVLVGVMAARSSGAVAEDKCPTDWATLPSVADRQRCADQKAQRTIDAAATAQARPYATTVPMRLDPRVATTPAPAGFIPDSVKAIGRVDRSIVGGIGDFPRPVTDLWSIGAISNPEDPTAYDRIVLYTRPPEGTRNAALGKFLVGNSLGPDLTRKYNQTWVCPRDVGMITIMNVSGSDGVVSFATSSGQSGTFNIASQTWSFAS
jgi:hypothetical protein